MHALCSLMINETQEVTTAQKKCREKCEPTLPEGKQNDRNSLRASKMASGHGLVQGTALKNGATRKMSQRYFCPAEYTLSQNLKVTLTLTFLSLGLGFGLVCTPLGKNIFVLFFWSYSGFYEVLAVNALRASAAIKYLRVLSVFS